METTEKATKSKNKLISNAIHNLRWLNLYPLIAANIYNSTVSTFYVFVAMTTLVNLPALALALSIFMGAGNLFITIMVAYNTMEEKNTEEGTPDKNARIKTNIFLFFAILSLLLNFASNVIGPYISLRLIGSALALPVASQGATILFLTIGVLTGLAFAAYNIIQIYEICQRINPSLYIKVEKDTQDKTLAAEFQPLIQKPHNGLKKSRSSPTLDSERSILLKANNSPSLTSLVQRS